MSKFLSLVSSKLLRQCFQGSEAVRLAEQVTVGSELESLEFLSALLSLDTELLRPLLCSIDDADSGSILLFVSVVENMEVRFAKA